jgi:tRNA G18 (ribose-2'-O)-methylase SpoU
MSPMPFEEFEAAYETLATAIDAAGRDHEALFLTKLVLLLGNELGDIGAFRDAIRAALDNLGD